MRNFIFEGLSEAAQAAEMQANFQQKIMPALKNKIVNYPQKPLLIPRSIHNSPLRI